MTNESSNAIPSLSTETNSAGSPTTNDLVNRVAQSAHATIDKLAEHAVPHVQRLQDGVEGASEMLHERADQVRDLGTEWTETLRTTVREHPLAAIGTAVAVGLLLARLTR